MAFQYSKFLAGSLYINLYFICYANKIWQGYATNALKDKQPNGKNIEQRQIFFAETVEQKIEKVEEKGESHLLRPIKQWIFSFPSF